MLNLLTEQVLDTIFASDLPIGLALLDAQLRYVRINETLARFNGVSRTETLGRRVPEVLPNAYPKVAAQLDQVLSGECAAIHFQVQAEVPGTPGLSEWEASYCGICNEHGRVHGIFVFAINISVERRLQRMHQENAIHLRRVLDSLFAFVGVVSPDGTLEEANRAPLEAAGVRASDVIGRPFWDTYWWSHDAQLQHWVRDACTRAAQGEIIREDVTVRMAGDTRMPLDFMLAPMRDAEGRITHLIPSAIDISARKADEALLKRTMARFQRTFESSPVGKALIDPPGQLALVNPAFCALFGGTQTSLLNTAITRLIPGLGEDAAASSLAELFDQDCAATGMLNLRMRGVRVDGREVETEVSINRIDDHDSGQLLITVADMTERLRAQHDLERSLREKTVLLNEVHHRVKNNLQVISSLLRLQARSAAPAVRAALEDSMMRVRAMALTHQLLYESRDFAALPLGEFLARLTALLREIYQLAEAALHVNLSALPPDQEISLSQAVPCGLLVNELVSNAVKHAFVDRPPGHIEIEARLLDVNHVVLSVRDDGIGIAPCHALGSTESLGFQLIPLLAQQIDARLTLHSVPEQGACFSLEFALATDP